MRRVPATIGVYRDATARRLAGTLTGQYSSCVQLPDRITVKVPLTVVLSLAYNGKLRDKVGGGDTFLGGDGAADATITLTLNAAGGRSVTAEIGRAHV